MVVLAAIFKVVDGKGEEFEREFRKLAPMVRKDPGAITYVLNRHVEKPNQYFVYEKYDDEEALKYHGSTPHFQEFFKNIIPIMAGPIELNRYQEIF
jgi:quinol monooxygenase YgiN